MWLCATQFKCRFQSLNIQNPEEHDLGEPVSRARMTRTNRDMCLIRRHFVVKNRCNPDKTVYVLQYLYYSICITVYVLQYKCKCVCITVNVLQFLYYSICITVYVLQYMYM